MMLGHVFETKRQAIFGIAEERFEKSGVEVDVVAEFDV